MEKQIGGDNIENVRQKGPAARDGDLEQTPHVSIYMQIRLGRFLPPGSTTINQVFIRNITHT